MTGIEFISKLTDHFRSFKTQTQPLIFQIEMHGSVERFRAISVKSGGAAGTIVTLRRDVQ